MMCSLTVGIYEVGIPEEWLQLMDTIAQVIKGQDIMDLDAVYTLVKSLLHGDALQVFQNEETLHMTKLNDYLNKVSVPEGVFAAKLSWEELVDVLEYEVPLQ
eukprot:15155452-Ditylum_brightwellii.AAC.1